MVMLYWRGYLLLFYCTARLYKKTNVRRISIFDSYEEFFKNYLTQIKTESDDARDMLAHKNIKFLFN